MPRFQKWQKKESDVIFSPHIIDELSADNDFDYIIVATNKLQLPSVLPSLKAGAGKANIVFFQNNWDPFDEIASYLRPEQYFSAFLLWWVEEGTVWKYRVVFPD